MSLRITSEECDCGNHVVIEKEPIGETPAEPIYADLVKVFFKIPELKDLPLEILESLDQEKEGLSFSFSFEMLSELGIDVAQMAFDADEYIQREKVFDIKKHKNEQKELTTGKPTNNNDPYPVDEKIEELESHEQFLKIHKIEYCDPDSNLIKLTKEVMLLSDKTEKRLVKLENILSTVMRNLFRIGSRMHINCVYYGGQSVYNKYKCIRCTHDDRISDGQIMTLDQCLCCDRYEPIIGQVYDILDETGQNIKQILDDNQMAFTTMEEYVKFVRQEGNYQSPEKVFLDTTKNTVRNPEEVDLEQVWEEGTIQDFNLVPVETQKPDVKYEDGSTSKKLKSSYGDSFASEKTSGTGFYSELEAMKETSEMVQKNTNALNTVSSAKVKQYIDAGKTWANSNVDSGLKRMQEQGYESILRELCEKNGVDPLLVLSIILVESGGNISPSNDATTSYRGLMQVSKNSLSPNWMSKPPLDKARENIQVGINIYKGKLKACWNTDNIVLGMCAYNGGEGVILGVSSKGIPPIHEPGLNKAEHSDWTYDQIAANLERNVEKLYGQKAIKEKLQYYPKINAMYQLLEKKAGFSPADTQIGNADFKFPFAANIISKIRFTSDFGMRISPITKKAEGHLGVDLATAQGTPILSPSSGKVKEIGFDGGSTGAGQYILIEHDDDIWTAYFHMVKGSQKVKKGDDVIAGQHIGNVGSTGGSTGPHLHFEIRKGKSRTGAMDPKIYFPFLKGQLGKSLKI